MKLPCGRVQKLVQRRLGGQRLAVAVEGVGQLAVVPVPAGLPAQPDAAVDVGRGHGGGAGDGLAAVRGVGEADEALLLLVAVGLDAGELAADPHVVLAAAGRRGHDARADLLGAGRAVVGVGEPGQQRRGVVHGLGEHVLPLVQLRELAHAAAVVGVRDAVEHVLVDGDVLGGAQAGVPPALGEGPAQVHREPAVEDAAAVALVGGVDAGPVDVDALDEGVPVHLVRVVLVVADALVGPYGRSRVGADDGEAVHAGVAVEAVEVAAEDDVVPVRGLLDDPAGPVRPALAFQEVSAPVLAFTAANFTRLVPRTDLKSPAMYRRPLAAASSP
ncbi:hypothetical protein [Streptomyces sp. MAR4 CNX-425]|uniref:hypothetical protein n=1 Tax=Streptomyces sp. MAR4 CNX-425 TaxID=3406343 RepID=UPI003B5026A5